MGRIASILERVRDSLSDPDSDRWSDARLLRLVDEAQRHIAVKAKLLRTKIAIPIIADIAEYSLPEDAFNVTRVLVANAVTLDIDNPAGKEPVPIYSHIDMDRKDISWETHTGTLIEAVIFDKITPTTLKIYPIPDTSDAVTEYTLTSDFGIVTDSTTDVVVPPFGLVGSITATASLSYSFTSDFGVVTDMAAIVNGLTVYYLRTPNLIDDVDIASALEIDAAFDLAIKHYVIGMAFRDDLDAQNRKLGSEALALFANEFIDAKKQGTTDGHTTPPKRVTYWDGF